MKRRIHEPLLKEETFPQKSRTVSQEKHTKVHDNTTTATLNYLKVFSSKKYKSDNVLTTKNGSRLFVRDDGTWTNSRSDGTLIIKLPDNTLVAFDNDGSRLITYPDGSKCFTGSDGTRVTNSVDGSESITSADGTRITTKPNGVRIITTKNGISKVTNADRETMTTGSRNYANTKDIVGANSTQDVMDMIVQHVLVESDPDDVCESDSTYNVLEKLETGAFQAVSVDTEMRISEPTNAIETVITDDYTDSEGNSDSDSVVFVSEITKQTPFGDQTDQRQGFAHGSYEEWKNYRLKVMEDGTYVISHPNCCRTVVQVDGVRTTTFKNGTRIVILADGIRITTYYNGTQVVLHPDGTCSMSSIVTENTEILHKDGTYAIIHKTGTRVVLFPNGTQVFSYTNGSHIVLYPDGTQTASRPDGTLIIWNKDGNHLECQTDEDIRSLIDHVSPLDMLNIIFG